MIYEVWSEGFRITGDYGLAVKHGEAEAATFRDACDRVLCGDPYYDAEKLSYWACRLFDNEADARKSFG